MYIYRIILRSRISNGGPYLRVFDLRINIIGLYLRVFIIVMSNNDMYRPIFQRVCGRHWLLASLLLFYFFSTAGHHNLPISLVSFSYIMSSIETYRQKSRVIASLPWHVDNIVMDALLGNALPQEHPNRVPPFKLQSSGEV
jgi:hypothetical protein